MSIQLEFSILKEELDQSSYNYELAPQELYVFLRAKTFNNPIIIRRLWLLGRQTIDDVNETNLDTIQRSYKQVIDSNLRNAMRQLPHFQIRAHKSAKDFFWQTKQELKDSLYGAKVDINSFKEEYFCRKDYNLELILKNEFFCNNMATVK